MKKGILIMQENEFSGAISMYHSTMQALCTHVNKLVASNFKICFPAPYLSLHAKYSHMPNMPKAELAPVSPTMHRAAAHSVERLSGIRRVAGLSPRGGYSHFFLHT